MHWDEFTTLRRALWIGGGQWSGKSTVAGILAERYGLTHYHYDYHDARGHWDRHTARCVRRGESLPEPRVARSYCPSRVAQSVEDCLTYFVERFEYVQDDLRALASPWPVLAEGWGLRPELVAPITSSTQRMVVMVPTEEFQRYQMSRVPRARAIRRNVANPELAERHRMARDRLVTENAVVNAKRLNIRVIEVDGSRDAQAISDLVADHFREFLP